MFDFGDKQLRELQLKEMELLKVFKEFCDRHGLLFYFCGGCCIGALRHKGFIPWDDDIDVFMPRKDYEKLYELWKAEGDNERFPILRTTKDFFSGNIFTTIVDTTGTWIKPDFVDLDIPQGIPMDILPLDGCPSGKWARRLQMINALFYSLYNAQVVPRLHGGIVAVASKILLAIVPKRLRYSIWRSCEKRMTKYPIEECEYITELCSGPHYMMNRYPKEAFDSAVYREFEGEEMPIPAGYDDYLRIAFGEYMEIPPLEKQKAHHDLVFADVHNSYKNYKGIYYCKNSSK